MPSTYIQLYPLLSSPFCFPQNGPCPLLAIANILSLRNQLPELPPGR